MVEVRRWIGGSPPQRYTETILTCDECEDHPEELYQYDGAELCLNCLINLWMDTLEYTVIRSERP